MKQRSRSFLLVLLTLGVGLSACKKDPTVEPDPVTPQAPTGVVKLTVVPEWEGAPMQRFTEYRNFMDYRVNVELLKLYLGEVRLANGGLEKTLSDVTLLRSRGRTCFPDLAGGSRQRGRA